MTEAVRLGARLVEFMAALVIAGAIVRSLVAAVRDRLADEALQSMRQRLAEGVISALSLATAATLLKTITLNSWNAIGMFASVLALRTAVKWTLTAELRTVGQATQRD